MTPFATGRLAFGRADAVRLLEAYVRATAGHRDVDPRRGLRFPVEGHVTDGHRAARFGAEFQQFVLDAESGPPVAEVADGLVVVEIGLVDPAFGSGAAHHEAALAVRLDGEAALVDGDGSN